MKEKLCVVCNQPLDGQKQKFCSNNCKQKHHYHQVKEQTNTYHSQTLRAIRRKLQLLELFGNACYNCGYNANLAALHFHHLDASKKTFKLGMRTLSNRSWNAILEEAKKCQLLCANCHAEKHNPELTLKNAQRITHGAAQ